jgi:threonine/homoserine/homoserine lactone efflux protein
MTSAFLTFLSVSTLIIVTPGPDTAMTVRNSLRGGWAAGIFTALGIATGQIVWALATSVGLVALLVASEPLFLCVKYAGAGYLVFLGATALIGALRPDNLNVPPANKMLATRLTSTVAFGQGLASNLGNPKMAVFFISILPQFADAGSHAIFGLVLLGFVFSILTFGWLAIYTVAAASVGRSIRSGTRRIMQGVSGTVLIALGFRIAMDQR